MLSTVRARAPASEGCAAEPVLFVEIEVEEVVCSNEGYLGSRLGHHYRNDVFPIYIVVLCDYPSLRGWYFGVLFNVQRTRSQRRDNVCVGF